MDDSRFDALARGWATRPSRRRLLRSVAGALAAVVATGAGPAEAKPCRAPGRRCRTADDCCSVACCDRTCCGDGQTCCGGVCVDLGSDPNNCGSCGAACSANHIASPTCANGACAGECDPGFADCNGNKRTDGCETDLLTDAANCGACGRACPTDQPLCSGGACVAPSCAMVGQACEAIACCPGLVCARPEIAECFGGTRTGCFCMSVTA